MLFRSILSISFFVITLLTAGHIKAKNELITYCQKSEETVSVNDPQEGTSSTMSHKLKPEKRAMNEPSPTKKKRHIGDKILLGITGAFLIILLALSSSSGKFLQFM